MCGLILDFANDSTCSVFLSGSLEVYDPLYFGAQGFSQSLYTNPIPVELSRLKSGGLPLGPRAASSFGPDPIWQMGGAHSRGLCGRILVSITVRKSTKGGKKHKNFPPAAGSRRVFVEVNSYFMNTNAGNFRLRRSMPAAGAKILLFRNPFIGICKAKLLAAGAKILLLGGPFIGICKAKLPAAG